jgi:Fur family ferric uptake transcriptional regulator
MMSSATRQEINDIRETLKRVNIKVTLPRIMIFQILRSAPQGMTAYDIENASLMVNNRINLSTIYSTLKLFQSTGLIQRYKMNLEQAMYSLNHLDGPIRISCKQCGCLEVFENAKLQDQIDQFCHLKQIPLQSFTLVLTIDSCPNCSAKHC